MAIQMLNHVAYRCRDAKETAEFYEGLLGMKLVHTIVQDRVPSTQELSPHAHVFFEMADGSWVAFFDVAEEQDVAQSQNPDWAQHLAMEVPSLEELTSSKQRLEDHGIDVLGPVDHGFIKSIYFYDPSGHRLELAVRTHSETDLDRYRGEAWTALDDWSTQKKEIASVT